MDRISYRVALGGIVSAFCLVGMFLTGIFPLLYILLPMLSGLLLLIVVMEVGSTWAWVTYAAVSLLSLFVTYDKEAALLFILLFGSYPILFSYLRRVKPAVLRLVLKLLFFNAAAMLYWHATIYLLGLTEMAEEFAKYGRYAGAAVLAILNPFFLLYDNNLLWLCELYQKRLKPRITGR